MSRIDAEAMSAKAISLLATVVLITTAAMLLVRRGVLATGPVSASLQVAGLVLVLWARFTLGLRSFHVAANPTPGALITTGPYRYIRNPIYSAAWLITWVGVAVHRSLANAMLGIVIAGTLVIKIACEEKLLRVAYPEYDEYARRTARLIPWVL